MLTISRIASAVVQRLAKPPFYTDFPPNYGEELVWNEAKNSIMLHNGSPLSDLHDVHHLVLVQIYIDWIFVPFFRLD